MEKWIRSSARLEDIPELINHIQLRLPVKDAVRTSVLSKSWLYAWSTIPTLRFGEAAMNVSKEQERMHLEVVDLTLMRYFRDKIPIKRIELQIDMENEESTSLAEKWIRPVAMERCLNELLLTIDVNSASFKLPEEILSGRNLSKIKVSGCLSEIHSLLMPRHPVINCVSLRNLYFNYVHLKEDVLHDILSTCRLLVKIRLIHCKGFNTIKIKNLPCLNEFRTTSVEQNRLLEIDDLPNLREFRCLGNPFSLNTYSLVRVTYLVLGNVIMDDAYLDMINVKFPLLENLILYMRLWTSESFHFTSASLKKLSLLYCPPTLLNVHVDAPKLFSFGFEGKTMPTFVLPATAYISLLEEIWVVLYLSHPVNFSFFLKMIQAPTLSIKCDIDITMNNTAILLPINVNILNLRKKVPFPAMNVHRLLFQTNGDEGLWECSPFFDAFFSICHPKYVLAKPDKRFKHNNHFCKLMASEGMEKNTTTARDYLNWAWYLKGFTVKSEKGEALQDSWRCSANRRACTSVFKLNWR